jgi:transglutaminase-like putative cysteine protease
MAASGFCALAGARSLDRLTLALTFLALFTRAITVAGWVRLVIPPKLIALLAVACAAFFPADFYFLSHDFFTATLHGVCFLAAVKILTARTRRDYLYIGAVAFLELFGAALISFHANFFAWLAAYMLFAIAALTSAEIQTGLEGHRQIVQSAKVRHGWRLATVALATTCGILVLTAGLFLTVPRTARAAAMFFPDAPRLTGFSNVVDLGAFGQIGKDTRPVMHILSYARPLPQGLKWRGTALSRFDGKRWSEPPIPVVDIPRRGMVEVAGPLQRSRRDARRLVYRVEVNSSDTGTLFIAGIPEWVNVPSPRLVRTAEDSFRVLPVTGEHLEYEVSAYPGSPLPSLLSAAERARYLQLPPVDQRIRALAREWAGQGDPLERALQIQRRLRHDFEYSLDSAQRPVRDPLAHFLFDTKRGYCEYFASAMAVMLRTLGTPSRVATGFQSGYFNDVSGMYVVRGSDAHAWVEGWVEGRGWITFDPTPSGAAPGTGLLSRIGIYLDAADSMWQQWVVAYDPGQQAALAGKLAEGLRSWNARRRSSQNWRDLIPAGMEKWGAAALGLGLLGWAAILWLPRLLRHTRGRVQLHRIARGGISAGDGRVLYEHMLDAMERRGYRKPPWSTPLEFARGLPGAENRRVAHFTSLYNSIRFGGNTAAAAELARLLRDYDR